MKNLRILFLLLFLSIICCHTTLAQNSSVLYKEGKEQFVLGNFDVAKNQFLNCINTFGNSTNITTKTQLDQSHMYLGVIEFLSLNFIESRKWMEKLVDRNASSGYIFMKKYYEALEEYINENFQKSIKLLTDAITYYDNAYAYYLRAFCNEKIGNYDKAQSDYIYLVNNFKNEPSKGIALSKLEKNDEAIEMMMKIIKKEKNYDNFFTLCCIYALNGNKEKSIENLEMAFQLGLKNPYYIFIRDEIDNIRKTAEFKNLIQKYNIQMSPRVKELYHKRETNDYKWAIAKGDIESLKDFINKYPESKWKEEVTDNINEISEWEILDKDSIIKVEKFLEKYPKGIYYKEASNILETKSWELAIKDTNIILIDNYLSNYPKGQFADIAIDISSTIKAKKIKAEKLLKKNWQISYKLLHFSHKKISELNYFEEISLVLSGDNVVGRVYYQSEYNGEIAGGSYGNCFGTISDNTIYLNEYLIIDDSGHQIHSNRKFLIFGEDSLVEIVNGEKKVFNQSFPYYQNEESNYPIASYLSRSSNKDSKDLYLLPIVENKDSLFRWFNLSSFNPEVHCKLNYLDDEDISNITVDAIVKSLSEDQFFYQPSTFIKLQLSSIPEFPELLGEFRTMNKFEIAANKEKFINKVREVKKLYQEAYYIYEHTLFQVSGKCYAFEKDYDYDKEILKVHVCVDAVDEDLYVATICIPFSLEDGQNLFKTDTISGNVSFFIYPGSKSIERGLPGSIDVPNIRSVLPPLIYLNGVEGNRYKFTTVQLDNLWYEQNVNSYRMDYYIRNPRIIKGFYVDNFKNNELITGSSNSMLKSVNYSDFWGDPESGDFGGTFWVNIKSLPNGSCQGILEQYEHEGRTYPLQEMKNLTIDDKGQITFEVNLFIEYDIMKKPKVQNTKFRGLITEKELRLKNDLKDSEEIILENISD